MTLIYPSVDSYDAAAAGDADAISKLEKAANKQYKRKYTILHFESEEGNTESVRFILRQFADKNLLAKLTKNEQTALHLAISGGHTEVAEVIIEEARRHFPETSFQTFLRQGDTRMDTALHAAVMEGNKAIVKLLVEADPTDRHFQNKQGKTPMFIAVEKGLNDIVEIISTTCIAPSLDGPRCSTAMYTNNLDQVKSSGGTPYKIMDRDALYVAAIAGDAEATAKLEMEADILNKNGETILHIESSSGNTERVRFILREFANKNLLAKHTIHKQTALHLAISSGEHTEVAEVLIDAARHLASSSSSTNDSTHDDLVTSFQAFLRQGDEDMDTALHAAVKKGNGAIVKLLLDADPTHGHIQNDEGKTAIYVAAEKGYTDIVKMICCSDRFSLEGPGGSSTALHAAIKNRDHGIEVVEILIDAARRLPSNSASDNIKNPVSSFQAFLRKGDEDKNTALHIAVMQRNLATAKLLLEADPSYPGSQNNNGQTPFHIAAQKGYADIAKMMCKTCATPVHLHGPGGRLTALHAVVKNLDEAKNEVSDLIEMYINVYKRVFISKLPDIDEYTIHKHLADVFRETDEHEQMILKLAVERNYQKVVKLILGISNPAYEDHWIGQDLISLMPLIYKAMDKEYKNLEMLLTQTFEAGAKSSKLSPRLKSEASFISAIRRRDAETVLSLLDSPRGEHLVTVADSLGWTALHHAAYHEFNFIIKIIVEALEIFGHEFVYKDMESTPFHVAAERGHTSTLILLMQLWPSESLVYVNIDKNGQNILHLAALQSGKEMIQNILRYCAEECKNELVNKQDNNGDTPLHLLIRRGCLVHELFKYEELDIWVVNNKGYTPRDMLYYDEKQIIDDQVTIKVALDHIDQQRDIFPSSVQKDVIFNKKAQILIDEKLAKMKKDARAAANCFADAIAGDPISRAALEIEADTPNEAGETILHVESKKGVIQNVRFIATAFAKKNLLIKLDNQNQTALYLAAHHGHTQVVEALLDAASRHLPSSSANDDTHNPVTPFQAYIRQATGPMRNTALHLAVLNCNVAIVKLLVQADPNNNHVQNSEGKSPIYVAAEKGYKEIVKEICETCTALSLDGPGGRTTALHALIHNIAQVTGAVDMLRMMVIAAKCWSTGADFEALFSKTDESKSTVLQLAVEKNNVDAVRLILLEDPAYQQGREIKRNGLMRLIYKAIDNKYSDDMINLLSQTYKAGIANPDHQDVVSLILAIKNRDEDSVLGLLRGAPHLVTFTEDNGWTPLHYAVYHEFDSIFVSILQALQDVGYQFVYKNGIPTPFHVGLEYGYTSILVRLMQLWPPPAPGSIADNSPYTVVNEDNRNILHLAAADNRKEVVEAILKFCPGTYKDKLLKQKDTNEDTPLHLLISHGCFIHELIKDKELDTMVKNKDKLTPWEMLYFKNDVVADQVHIKIAIDDIQTNQSAWKFWANSTEKNEDIWKDIAPSKRKGKDLIFDEREKSLMEAENEEKKKELERYKTRTNTQIIVTALITTVTFTVGFTMPGGLRPSGEVDEGLVLLSKKTAFNTFMISDALGLLLSTSSLFFYFLESMYEDPRQVWKLNTASTVLNVISVMAMMLTFIAGTYLVLSHSPALAITICIIGSLFFLLIITLLIKMVYDRLHRKRNLD